MQLLTGNNYPAKPKQWSMRHAYLWLVYLVLAVILTWPTIARFTTHVPGDGSDDPAIAWNLWWIKYTLLNRGQNPLVTDYMAYPIGLNLAFYTLTVLNGLTTLPLLLNFGVITASNLHLLFTFAAGAYGVFLLVRYLLTTMDGDATSKRRLVWLSAAIAGGCYAFASSKLSYVALGQFNIASTHWLPLAVLYVIRARRPPERLKNAVLAGLFLAMQAWTEMTYASFLLIFIGLYWLYWLLVGLATRPGESSRWRLLRPHLRAAAVLGLTFALGISPLLAQLLPEMQVEGDFWVQGSGFAEAFSADLLGFIIPTVHHPLVGHWVAQTNIAFQMGQHIYIGFVLLGLLVIAGITGYRSPEIRFWLIAAGLFGLLCLGPVITINGHSTGLPGPFVLLQNLPFFKGNRYPSRYSVMLILCLSILAGYALVQLGRWLSIPRSSLSAPRSPLSALFLALPLLFIFEHLSTPLPQSDLRVPAAYQLIAADAGDFTILDIPLAWRNGFRVTGPLTTQFMFGQFYQTSHHKRLLQANTSRNPEFKFQYFTQAPILNSLLALTTGHALPAERWAADRAIAADVLNFFEVNYVVVRPFHYDKFDGAATITVTEQNAIPYLESVLPLEPIYAGPELKLYRVNYEPGATTTPFRVDTNSPLAPLYFGEGWGHLTPGRPVAAQRRAARLLLPMNAGQQRLSLRLRLPDEFQSQTQALRIELNGWQSPPQAVTPEWHELSFELPAEAIRPGLNNVRLHFERVVPLDRTTGPPVTPNITVVSAGEEVGDFGHIYVNGFEFSPNQRGYNVAVIQPNGAVIAAANFDTHLDPAASTALADFITAAPANAFIAVAAADEASLNLGEAAVQSLQAIGARGDLWGCFRCSHALLYNPLSGTTLEALDPLGPAGVTAGWGLTEPGLAALVDWIRVESVAE